MVWIDLPSPEAQAGREQAGRRPALLLCTLNGPTEPHTAVIIPTTSKKAALRYKFTVEVEASEHNGLSTSSVLLVFQVRAIDNSRIIDKIGRLETDIMEKVEDELKELLGV